MNTNLNSRTNIRRFLLSFGALFALVAIPATVLLTLNADQTNRNLKAEGTWAFEETFDYGTPTSPSQSLLPKTFDYVITHRNDFNHPVGNWPNFPADHGSDCSAPPNQHSVTANHTDNMTSPGSSFFICNNHMMSSIGDVDAYSVSNFYPRQEFDFTNGGTLEFDSSIYRRPGSSMRTFWEVVLVPRNLLQLAPALDWLPNDEKYPKERIILRFTGGATREMEVGTGAFEPAGVIGSASEWQGWPDANPGDEAGYDHKIRRTNRVTFENNKITWGTQRKDGSWQNLVTNVSQGLPFKKAIVMFKMHAYTPEKDGNPNDYTNHWDNIRFTGPKVTPFDGYESPDVILQHDMNEGTTRTQTINLPRVGTNPYILGQIHYANFNTMQLSINGNSYFSPKPHSQVRGCWNPGWSTFYVPIQASQLKVGTNTLTWKLGSRAGCSDNLDYWPKQSIKGVEIQMDAAGGTTTPPPPPPPTPAPTLPVVSLTSPINGATLSGNVSLAASITNGVTISKMEFFAGNTLLNTDTSSPYAFTWNSTTVANGSQTILAKATDSAGNIGSDSVVVTVNNTISNPPPPPPPPTISGVFKGEYFDNRDFTNLKVTRDDPKINFNWGTQSPAGNIGADTFSIRWTGTFNFTAGKYRFNSTSDDGSRVYLDNVLILNGFTDHSEKSFNKLVDVTEGSHTVKIEYFESYVDAVMRFNWVKHSTCYDMTGDFLVNDADLKVVANNFGKKGSNLPWDVNSDRNVNSLDLSLVRTKNNTTCQ